MGWFRKKRETREAPDETQTPRECDHKWVDFDWYMTSDVDGRYVSYNIYEPYVCIHCKARKDVELDSESFTMPSNQEAWELLDDVRKKYPKIKDRAFVEDEINDMQLVDREYIKYASMVLGSRLPS